MWRILRINVGDIQAREGHFNWMLCHGSEHRGQVTGAVTSDGVGDIRMHVDIVHRNPELSEQRATLLVMTRRRDI